MLHSKNLDMDLNKTNKIDLEMLNDNIKYSTTDNNVLNQKTNIKLAKQEKAKHLIEETPL